MYDATAKLVKRNISSSSGELQVSYLVWLGVVEHSLAFLFRKFGIIVAWTFLLAALLHLSRYSFLSFYFNLMLYFRDSLLLFSKYWLQGQCLDFHSWHWILLIPRLRISLPGMHKGFWQTIWENRSGDNACPWRTLFLLNCLIHRRLSPQIRLVTSLTMDPLKSMCLKFQIDIHFHNIERFFEMNKEHKDRCFLFNELIVNRLKYHRHIWNHIDPHQGCSSKLYIYIHMLFNTFCWSMSNYQWI